MKYAHKFVDTIPPELEPHIIYVSIRYRTSKHLCPCGCGCEVVTPIRPNKWSIMYNGVSISLYPSIGNWSLACKSHYWITKSKIVWAKLWTTEQIEWGRTRQRVDDEEYFRSLNATSTSNQNSNWKVTFVSWCRSIGRYLRGTIFRRDQ